MKINADFENRVLVHSADLDWIESPMAGVDRRPLDRVGEEVARATSIVRYAPGSEFSPHVHTGGEEFLVLDGVFQDEHGDFPAGSYIRNPPQSSHKPGSLEGCVIFVKLWQFDLEDRTHVRLSTENMAEIPHRHQHGVSVIPLYKDKNEEVSLQVWEPNTDVVTSSDGGVELLVLDGEFTENGETLKKHSWLRVPAGTDINASTSQSPVKVWVKTGHLNQVDRDITNVNNR